MIPITDYPDLLAYSPRHAPHNPDLRGVWTPTEGGDAYLCAPCHARLSARGISIKGRVVWRDESEPHGVCAGCGA